MAQVMDILEAPDVIGHLNIEILLMLGILTSIQVVHITADTNNSLDVPFA